MSVSVSVLFRRLRSKFGTCPPICHVKTRPLDAEDVFHPNSCKGFNISAVLEKCGGKSVVIMVLKRSKHILLLIKSSL